MSLQLQKGRPENVEGRLEKEIRTYDLLDELQIEYERVDHEAAELFGCHPCINTSSLRLKISDVFGTFLEKVHHDYTVVKLLGED